MRRSCYNLVQDYINRHCPSEYQSGFNVKKKNSSRKCQTEQSSKKRTFLANAGAIDGGTVSLIMALACR